MKNFQEETEERINKLKFINNCKHDFILKRETINKDERIQYYECSHCRSIRTLKRVD